MNSSKYFLSQLFCEHNYEARSQLTPLDYVALYPKLDIHQIISLYQRMIDQPQRLKKHWNRMVHFFAQQHSRWTPVMRTRAIHILISQLCKFYLPSPTIMRFDNLQLTHDRLIPLTAVEPFDFAKTPRADPKWRKTYNQKTWQDELKQCPTLNDFALKHKTTSTNSNVSCFLGTNGGNFFIPPEKRDILTYLCMKSLEVEQKKQLKRQQLVCQTLRHTTTMTTTPVSSLWSASRANHYTPNDFDVTRHTLNEMSTGTLSRFIIDIDMSFPLLGEHCNVEQWIDPCAPQPALEYRSLVIFLRDMVLEYLKVDEDKSSPDLTIALYSASGVVFKDAAKNDVVYPRNIRHSFCKPSFTLIFPNLCMTPQSCKQLTILLQKACQKKLGRLFELDERIMDDQIHDGYKPHTRMLYCDKDGYVVCRTCMGLHQAGQLGEKCQTPRGAPGGRCFRTFAGRPSLPYAWIPHNTSHPAPSMDWSSWAGASYRSCSDDEKEWSLKTLEFVPVCSLPKDWTNVESSTFAAIRFKPKAIPLCLPTEFWIKCYTELRTVLDQTQIINPYTPPLKSTLTKSSTFSSSSSSSSSNTLKRMRAKKKKNHAMQMQAQTESKSSQRQPPIQPNTAVETLQVLYLKWIKNVGLMKIPFPSERWANETVLPHFLKYWGPDAKMDVSTGIRLRPTLKQDNYKVECLAKKATTFCLRGNGKERHDSNQSIVQLTSFGLSLSDYSCRSKKLADGVTLKHPDGSRYLRPPQELVDIFFVSVECVISLIKRSATTKEFIHFIRK